jgi:hypothetical protein
MAVELEIVWDGNVPGLSEHRLSLEAFGPALNGLLSAIRRIASDLEMQARGPARGAGRGRLARQASNLDVQIVTIRTSSPVAITTQVVPIATPDRPLIDDLPDRALDVFLQDIESEARGAPAHYRVRRYLKSLPSGLATQTYIHRDADGQVRGQVKIGEMALAQITEPVHLVELWGTLVGVGFEPGRQEIKIRAATGELMTVSAEENQVEAALGLRLQDVYALAVTEPDKTRLLRLGPDEPEPSPPDVRADHIFNAWSGLLNRLAQ